MDVFLVDKFWVGQNTQGERERERERVEREREREGGLRM